MSKALTAVAIALLVWSEVVAQEQQQLLPNIPPPAASFVARAPDPSSWLITIKASGNGPAAPFAPPNLPPKYLKQQFWTKAGDKMRCVNDWTDGKRTTDWVAGAVKFHQSPYGEGLKLFNPSSHPSYHDFSKTDFEMLSWLSTDDYVGAVDYQGEPCYLFRAKRLAPQLDANPNRRDFTVADLQAPKSPTSALISVKTRLPVAIANGDGQFLYRFQSAPAGELTMPEPYASLWKAFNVRR